MLLLITNRKFLLAYMHTTRVMNVDGARDVGQDKSIWHSVISAYPIGSKALCLRCMCM